MSTLQLEVENLNLAEAIAFFAVTIHRHAGGQVVPTVTIVADEATEGHEQELRAGLGTIVSALRKAYAPQLPDLPTTADGRSTKERSMNQDQKQQQDTTEQQSETNKTQADVNKQQSEQNEQQQEKQGGEQK